MPQIPRFEELDFQKTPIGDLILRKRTVLSLENQEIYEIILGNSFLMSSMFTVVEQELSRFGLAATKASFPDKKLDVVVGGLGLGYTARAALEFPEVGSLRVVDYLQPVIEWHEKDLVPLRRLRPLVRRPTGREFFKIPPRSLRVRRISHRALS